MDNNLLLMANPNKIKRKKINVIKTNYLYSHIKSKYNQYDDNVINELYNKTDTFINNIDTDEIEVKYILKELIDLAIFNSINFEYI